MEVTPVTLTGERARLVPMEAGHAEALFEAARDPDIWAYMPLRVTNRTDMVRIVEEALRAQAQGTDVPYVIEDRETGRVVGSTRFCDITLPHRSLEIGWTWLSPQVWRTRINTECKYLLLRHAFETLDLLRVQLKTDARNLRSQRAIERLGAVKEGVLRHHRVLPDGYVRDSVYYSILAEEWPGVKARLEAMLSRPDTPEEKPA